MHCPGIGGSAGCEVSFNVSGAEIFIFPVFPNKSADFAVGMFQALEVETKKIGTVSFDEFKLLEEEILLEEAGETAYLPALAERQETLRRANEALDRARELLAQVNRLDFGAPISASDPESPLNPVEEGRCAEHEP